MSTSQVAPPHSQLQDVPLYFYKEVTPGVFASTAYCAGAWSPEHQHGGPPTALLARSIEHEARLVSCSNIVRVTVMLFLPVPLATVKVETSHVRIGRKASHITASLFIGTMEYMRMYALCMRSKDLSSVLPSPPKPIQDAMRFVPMSVKEKGEVLAPSRWVGYKTALDIRMASNQYRSGAAVAWFRQKIPLIEGEESPSGFQRLALVSDSLGGVTYPLSIEKYSHVNPDLTLHILRPPIGEWVAMDAQSNLNEKDGNGLAYATFYDEQGKIGIGCQSNLIEHHNYQQVHANRKKTASKL